MTLWKFTSLRNIIRSAGRFCGVALTALGLMTAGTQAANLNFFTGKSAYDAAVLANPGLLRTDVNLPGANDPFTQPADISITSSPTNGSLKVRSLTSVIYLSNSQGTNPSTDQLMITPGSNVRAIGFDYLVGLPGTNPSDFFASEVFFQGESTPRAGQTNFGGGSGSNTFFFGVISDMPLVNLLLKSTGGGNKSAFQSEFIKAISYATVSSVSAVPLPAALPLYGTGLAIMGFIGWRRKHKFTETA